MDSREETMLRILCVLLARMGGTIEINGQDLVEVDDQTVIAERDDTRDVLVVHLIPSYIKIGTEAPAKPITEDPLTKAAWDRELAKWLIGQKTTVPIPNLNGSITLNSGQLTATHAFLYDE